MEPTSAITNQKKNAARRILRSPWTIAGLLLLLPTAVAILFGLPRYYSFTALGETVSMQEIGVNSNVRFVYVREGVARNLYERLSVKFTYPDAVFTRVDSSAEEDYDDMLDYSEYARDETIYNALESADELSDSASSDDDFDSRAEELIQEASDYYGDSIGLMLGIGLYSERQREDFSRGGTISIAGTGTMEEDHSVGSVGSIRDKLRTAEAEGIDLFFVPKDKETFLYEGLSNEEEAERVAEELHLRMKIIPVASLEEAISYLEQNNI